MTFQLYWRVLGRESCSRHLVFARRALRRNRPLSVELRFPPRGARVEATLLRSPTLMLGSPALGVA